mgnify:CR=1 FL=1
MKEVGHDLPDMTLVRNHEKEGVGIPLPLLGETENGNLSYSPLPIGELLTGNAWG